MRIINDTIEGDFLLEENLKLNGMVTGVLTVKDGGVLELCGMCCGDLIIETGGKAIVNGMVIKNVVNHGGEAKIFGTVNGVVRELGGTTMIDQKAVVKGQVI